jgi:hypothetical protein
LGGSVLSSIPAAAQTPPSISVTISVFSGRPDPEFKLAASAELDKLRSLFKSAAPYTKSVQGSIIRPVLGYRGIVVDNHEGVGALPASFAVYNGIIEIRTDKPTHLIDKNRTLEKTLLDLALAAKAIDSKLHALIANGW